MELKQSPLAPSHFPVMPRINGLDLFFAETGLKYLGRPDLLLANFSPGTAVAGILTKSTTPGVPVQWCKNHLGKGVARGLIVNAGNANVFTGEQGRVAVEKIAHAAASTLDCLPSEVMLASTGVIGEFLEYEKITAAISNLQQNFKKADWETAARAISTTDTFPKGAIRTSKIGDVPVTITGIAKGSGMIAPDMATMLAFVFTDACLDSSILLPLLKRHAGTTFNCITVDSDTSTSDTLMIFATNQVNNQPHPSNHKDPLLRDFDKALHDVLLDLAIQIIKDGEGAQKLIQIDIKGATSKSSARRIGLAIANSPLVKTAIAGEDANWGRVVMAVGKSGERANRDRMAISFGNIPIANNGKMVSEYDETPVSAHMRGKEIHIEVDVGVGKGKASVWTCDFSHGYIDINADYRS